MPRFFWRQRQKGALNLLVTGAESFFASFLRAVFVVNLWWNSPTLFSQKLVIRESKIEAIAPFFRFFPNHLHQDDKKEPTACIIGWHFMSYRDFHDILPSIACCAFFLPFSSLCKIDQASLPSGPAYHAIIQERFHCQSVYAADDYPMLPYHPTKPPRSFRSINKSELLLI